MRGRGRRKVGGETEGERKGGKEEGREREGRSWGRRDVHVRGHGRGVSCTLWGHARVVTGTLWGRGAGGTAAAVCPYALERAGTGPLLPCYAMSVGYAAMRCVVLSKTVLIALLCCTEVTRAVLRAHLAMLLCTCYAMSGTQTGYAATHARHDVRLCCYGRSYEMCGTDPGYAATLGPVLLRFLRLRHRTLPTPQSEYKKPHFQDTRRTNPARTWCNWYSDIVVLSSDTAVLSWDIVVPGWDAAVGRHAAGEMLPRGL
eukprot:3033897-Rhodomonas_salina.1